MKGWFQVPGIRPEGDRTLKEQMMGLAPALDEVYKAFTAGTPLTVLDLGCAEGLIGLEFARAGAADVLGIEMLEEHLSVARKACRAAKQMRFVCANLKDYIPAHPDHPRFDIVLALGIIHKLPDPAVPLRFAAKCAKTLLLFRAPGREKLKRWDGTIKAKHGGLPCNVPQIMQDEGFVEERLINGVRGEAAQYWRRSA